MNLKRKAVIIFGIGNFAKLMYWYLKNTTDEEVVCFTVNKEYIDRDIMEGLPVIEFETISEKYTIQDYKILIAIGYSNMNKIREDILGKCRDKGYEICSYIHPSSIVNSKNIGQGNIILENCVIQPFAVIGDGNLLWYSVNIAHDCTIGNFNTFAGASSLSGYINMGNNCFIGNNATIKNEVTVADYTLVGAGAYISRDTKEYEVIVPNRSCTLNGKISTSFI